MALAVPCLEQAHPSSPLNLQAPLYTGQIALVLFLVWCSNPVPLAFVIDCISNTLMRSHELTPK